jgi:hypothetical protein
MTTRKEEEEEEEVKVVDPLSLCLSHMITILFYLTLSSSLSLLSLLWLLKWQTLFHIF